MPTSIQETGGLVTAPLVRSALEIAEKEFKRRGISGGLESFVHAQQHLIFEAEIVQYMATVNPGYSVSGFTVQQNAAAVALQTSLKLLDQPNDR